RIGWKEHVASNHEIEELGTQHKFEHLWPYFIGDGEVSGLHVALNHPEKKKGWAAADVNGSLRFSQQNAPIMEFHGLFHRGDKELPFHLTGEGSIEDEKRWKVAFDANFFDQEEIGAYFALTSQGEKRFTIEGEGKSLGPDQLSLFQHIIGVYIPQVEKVVIEEGRFDVKGGGWIEDKELKRCELLSFSARDVVGHLIDQEMSLRGKNFSAKGEFDLSTPDFFDGTNWEGQISGGECTIKGSKVEKIDLFVAMHDQYLKPSTLTCQYEGIQATFAFEGLYTHLNINVDTLLYPEKIGELLHIKEVGPLSDPVALDLDLKLKTNESCLGVEGTLGFIREKEKGDLIEFGWSLDLKQLAEGKWLSALELGWFRGENISADTLNLPLMVWDRDFRGRGAFGIEGTFNSRAVEFSIDPTQLKYESKAIDIDPRGKEEEKVPNCNFFFDFKEKIWRGKIPLKRARVQEHAFGIHFDTFTSEVDLEGTEVLFQNVDAVANGVHFQAEVAVNFALEDRSELKIDTYAINGTVREVMALLDHFETFKGIEFPLTGTVTSGPGDMHLHAYVGDVQELLEWRIALHLDRGNYLFSNTLGFKNLSGDLFYSAEEQLYKIKEVAGDLTLTAGESPKSYSLNVPLLELDAVQGVLHYDCRLEAPTYEICRIVGEGVQEKGEFFFH
ncbi:MAG: hypothetical protein KDK76_04520, partial [Chlamydiia bacterium]|nr:hypothetical protein [Chlamydiia bacterium]